MATNPNSDLLRRLPRVDDLLREPNVAELLQTLPRSLVVDGIRAEVDDRRTRLLAGSSDDTLVAADSIAIAAEARVRSRLKPRLRNVINATGVVLHTNLGRASLSREILLESLDLACGFSNLEYDLGARGRGSRYDHSAELLRELTGAEDSLVVNNNAAAMVLMLAALAKGREVIVSRGELIEIGGSFRLPEIFEQGGARLVEVGATNRTHLRDYERAITENTAMLLKVHRSNFDMVGFTCEVSGADLAEVGRARSIPTCEDLGSGCLVDLKPYGIDYVNVAGRVADGLDIVTFSGDKMLGGPQAGIIVGRRDLVQRMRNHPLTRAFRVDKLTLAALERSLITYVDGTWREKLPAMRMLTEGADVLCERATALASLLRTHLPAADISVVESDGRVGGGALPSVVLPGFAVRLSLPNTATNVDARLRGGRLPVVCRLVDGALYFDVRTVLPGETETLAVEVASAVSNNLRSSS